MNAPPFNADDFTAKEGPSVRLLSLGELQAQAAAMSWLVKSYIPIDSVGLLFGGSQSFKSFVSLDLALHIAHGMKWLGCRTRKGPVIIIAAEGASGIWRRIHAWHSHHGIDWQEAEIYVITQAVDLSEDAFLVVEAADALGVKPALVIVDTLSQTFSGEENSATEIASYLRELGTLFRLKWSCCVLVVHHTGHEATERPRGSSALKANTDFMLGVFRDSDQMLATMTCVKQKDGEMFEDVSFSLTVIELGDDDDGDKITSLVASAVTNRAEVLDLMEHEEKRGRGGKTQLLIGLLQNGMHEKELRHSFYEKCNIDNQDAKRQAYFRAANWAKKAGVYEVADGRVIMLDLSRCHGKA